MGLNEAEAVLLPGYGPERWWGGGVLSGKGELTRPCPRYVSSVFILAMLLVCRTDDEKEEEEGRERGRNL